MEGSLTKLDTYNYIVVPGVVRIVIDGPNDPTLVDILSELNLSEGNLYVDGHYYSYLDEHSVYLLQGEWFLDLNVVKIA